jgi:hypothetical protein
MSEIKTDEPVSRFIDHVAASLWAATHVPEITVAIQRLLKAGFRRALQVEGLVIIPYLVIPLAEFHYYCDWRSSNPKSALPSPTPIASRCTAYTRSGGSLGKSTVCGLNGFRKGRACCDPMVSFVDRSVLGSFDTTYLPRDSFEFLKLAAANSFSNFGVMCTYE